MELQNLCSESLAKLTIGIIEKIEQDLRDFAQHFTEEAAAGGKALEKLKHVFMIRGLNGKVYKVKKIDIALEPIFGLTKAIERSAQKIPSDPDGPKQQQ